MSLTEKNKEWLKSIGSAVVIAVSAVWFLAHQMHVITNEKKKLYYHPSGKTGQVGKIKRKSLPAGEAFGAVMVLFLRKPGMRGRNEQNKTSLTGR